MTVFAVNVLNSPHRSAQHEMPTVSCSMICLSLCLLVLTVRFAKLDEPIQMLRGTWTCVGPRNLVTGPDPSYEGAFWGSGVIVSHCQTCPQFIFSALFRRSKQRCDLRLPLMLHT